MAHQGAKSERWRQIETICETALGLEPEARPDYLARVCGEDQRLRGEVEALLAQESAARGFLSNPPGAQAASLLADAQDRDLAGQTIGDYEILARLGAGGMGVVYRAKDLTLGRDVAIKVLPAAVAASPERLSRFRREAKLLATLSHPNIGAIHGLIETGATCALVLELLEGETLVAALERGPMRVAKALTIGIAVAEALDHVHRRGITHRDLKPSNVILTATGPKLLDFGVGKLSVADGAPQGFTTETEKGALVGTLNYMAPEQLESGNVGPRSDVFAFGALVYELIAGRKAFDGPSRASIIAAIIHRNPPRLSSVSVERIPERLDRVIAKCLVKDPNARWQSARDLADELRWIADESSDANAARPARTRQPWLLAVAATLATVAALATAAWLWLPFSRAAAPAPPIRFAIHTPDDVQLREDLAISPDGTLLVLMTTSPQGGRQLLLRRLDQFESVLLATAAAGPLYSPTFSPDGESVAFILNGRLYQKPIRDTSAPTVLTELPPNSFHLSWSSPEGLVFGGREQPISRVPASGGVPVAITEVRSPAELDHHTPHILPGGQALLFAIHYPRNRFAVAVQSLVTGERKTLIENAYAPSYTDTGHLLFARDSNLLAVPFDLEALEVRGPETMVLEGIGGFAGSGEMDYRVSRSGVLAYQPLRVPAMRSLVLVDRTGKETPLPLPPNTYEAPRFSPDARQIAFGTAAPWRVWVYEVASDKLMSVSTEQGRGPMWTRDGSALLYAVDRPQASHILQHRFDGSAPVSIGSSINDLWPTGFAHDGTLILNETPPTEINRVSRMRPGEGAQPQPLAVHAGFPSLSRVSPDGRWVASTARSENRLEVFVQSATGDGPPVQITVDGGREPVWSGEGRELFFRRGDGIFSIAINTASGFTWSRPVLLFRGAYILDAKPGFDVAPDGRFVMLKADPRPRPPARMNVVLNWTTELLMRVPIPRRD